MNSCIEFEQFNIKHTEDPLSLHEIKTELVEIKSEIKTEAEESDDVEHRIYPIAELSLSIKTKSEVENTQESLDKLLEDYENKSQGKKNETEVSLPETDEAYFEGDKDIGLLNDHAEEMFKTCSICNHSLFQCNNPNVHKQSTNALINYSVGSKSLSSNSSITKNFYFFPEKKVVACNFCGHKNNLTRHKRLRTNNKFFTCDICNKSFFDQSTFTRHSRTHTNEKPFSCNLCRKSFSQKSHLTRHLHIHTNEKPFACDVCSKSFSQKSDLAYHIRTHTNEKPFTCNVCTKSFFQKSDLTQHLLTHTNEKRFTCNVCRKSFSKKSNLSVHTRTHSIEKPFTCEICNVSFYNKHDLTRHIRIHTDEKPFSCRFCNKSFSVLSNLAQHIRIHTNEKPFTCDSCRKSFSSKSTLIQHIHTHANKKRNIYLTNNTS